MRLLFVDPRKKRLGVLPEVLDDLWVLEKVIEQGDFIEADVLRSVVFDSGKKESVKIHVKVQVEDVEFHEYSSSLRVKGKIVEAHPEEYVGKGKYQTVSITPGRSVVLEKKVWRSATVDLLRKAEKETTRPEVILVSMDDEEATVALYSYRVRLVGTVRNKAHGKMFGEGFTQYFGDVLHFVESLKPEYVIVGGPGFIFENFVRFASERGRKKYVGVRTSVAGEKGIYELVMSRGRALVEEYWLSKILAVLDEFRKRLATGGPVAMGREALKKAEEGAVDVLVVHESLLRSDRASVLEAMDNVQNFGGKVFIIPRDVEGAAMVEKLGGAIALLRF